MTKDINYIPSPTKQQPDIIVIIALKDSNVQGATSIQKLEKGSSFFKYANALYKIDSATFSAAATYDKKIVHAIAGITCSNKRYFYNGHLVEQVYPCKLYNWDWLTPDNEFDLVLGRCTTDGKLDDKAKTDGKYYKFMSNNPTLYLCPKLL